MRLELDLPGALGVDWALGEDALESLRAVSALCPDKALLREVDLATDELGDTVPDMLEFILLDLPWDC
jgi:hypothetical protein